MGCDIHLIVQVKKGDEWEYVPELPGALCTRNYNTFAFLANIRNEFQINGFKPKGLPTDMVQMKYDFKDCMKEAHSRYLRESSMRAVFPNGETADPCDRRFEVKCENEKEMKKYEKWSSCSIHGETIYTGYDYEKEGAVLKDVPVKEIYKSFDDFVKEYYSDYWDNEAKTYGYWNVDFGCEDYHTPSWLTLKELIDTDKSSYMSCAARVPAGFYKAFIEMGGKLPEGMIVIEKKNRIPSDLVDAFAMAFNPDVIIMWPDTKNSNNPDFYPVIKGIAELSSIAEKYSVSADSIRIVFAFDN